MKKSALAAFLAACALGMAGSAYQSWSAGRDGWEQAFRRQAEDLGSFARASLASRNDLLVLERFKETMRSCDDVAWILIQDPAGRVTFSSDAAEMGTVLDSPRAKLAGSVKETLVQRGPASGQVEVDVPLGSAGVLRVSGVPRSQGKAETWLVLTLVFGAVGLVLAIWLSLGNRAAPPPQEPSPAA